MTNSDISPVPVSEFVDDSPGRPDETQANKNLKPNKKETTIARGDPLCSDNSEISEWLQEFRENLVDDEIPFQGGSHASSSHEVSLEPTTRDVRIWVSTVFIYISLKTEIVRCERTIEFLVCARCD